MYWWAILVALCLADKEQDETLQGLRGSVDTSLPPVFIAPVAPRRRIVVHPEELEDDDLDMLVQVSLVNLDMEDEDVDITASMLERGIHGSLIICTVLLTISGLLMLLGV